MTRRLLLGAILLLVTPLARAQGIELPSQPDCEADYLKAKGAADQARWDEACAGFQALLERKDDATGVVAVTEVFSRGWRSTARGALLALPPEGRAAYEKLVGAQATEALTAAKGTGKREALWAVERRWPASEAAREARRLLSGDDAPPAEAIRALETMLDADPQAGPASLAGIAIRIARLAAKCGEPARIQLLSRRAAKEWADRKTVVDGKEVSLADAIKAEAPGAVVASSAERPHWNGSLAGVGLFPEAKRMTRFLWEQDVEEEEESSIQAGGMVVLYGGGGPGPASPPVVSDGRLYLVAGDTAMCKEVERGNHIWTYRVPQAAAQGGAAIVQRDGEPRTARPLPPCVDGGLIAFEYGRNHNETDIRGGRPLPHASEIHVLDAANGKRLWSWTTEKDEALKGKSSLSSPILTPEGLFTLALADDKTHRTATLLMFDRERGDGGPKWRRTLSTVPTGATPWSSFAKDANSILAYADGAVIVATNLGVVAAVDATSGEVLWAYAYGNPKSGGSGNVPGNTIDVRRVDPPASWVIASDGAVFFGAADTPYAWGLVPRTGKQLWHNPIVAGMAPTAFAGGRLYLAGPAMYVVEVVTGKRDWFEIPGAVPQAAIASNAALCWSGKALFVRDLAHGDEVGQYAWEPPAEPEQAKLKPPDGAILPLGDRILFQARGQLYCFRLEDPPPAPEDIDARVDRWIAQLASPKYAERSAAANALLEAGEPADAKLKAAAESTDREVSWRADEVLREKRLGRYWHWNPKGPK